MFIALSTHYVFAHSVNARDASTIGSAERGDLAKQAYEKGSETVRAVLAVCGGDYRQTYLHDMVYGLQKLFLLLGKPYLGCTEGNESAHCEMKKDFHCMVCHSNKKYGNVLQGMRLHHLRKATFTMGSEFAPPTKESEAGLGMDLGVGASKRQRVHKDAAIGTHNAHMAGGKVAIMGSQTHGSSDLDVGVEVGKEGPK